MKITLQAPSKTFLAGEYAVLDGEPGLVLNTKPNFKMVFTKNSDEGIQGIHPNSPAGKFLAKNPEIFKGWGGTFEDPHEGAGGFGASSAQFVFVSTLKRWIEVDFEFGKARASVEALLNEYSDVNSISDVKPSGTDVVAQALGGITFVDRQKKNFKILTWKFKDLDFLIVKTKLKVNTHDALKTVSMSERALARDIVTDIVQSLETNDSAFMIENVKEYAQWLSSNELVHDNTRQLLIEFIGTEVKAAKGCGALGADTLLLMFHPDDKEKVLQRLPSLHLRPIAGSKDLAPGVNIGIDRTPQPEAQS